MWFTGKSLHKCADITPSAVTVETSYTQTTPQQQGAGNTPMQTGNGTDNQPSQTARDAAMRMLPATAVQLQLNQLPMGFYRMLFGSCCCRRSALPTQLETLEPECALAAARAQTKSASTSTSRRAAAPRYAAPRRGRHATPRTPPRGRSSRSAPARRARPASPRPRRGGRRRRV